jgi:hypothetical protein
MASGHADVLPGPQSNSDQVRSRPRSPVLVPALIAAEGVTHAVVGLDGLAVWQGVRVLVMVTVTCLAAWSTRRAGRPGRGVIAAVAGISGTVAGAGVASAHLSKAGLDAAAFLAVIVLVSGLILLGWGAVVLVRATPG